MKKFGATLGAVIVTAGAAVALDIPVTVVSADLPKNKQTVAGLYLTPSEAASVLERDPAVVFLDVRDPVEVMFVGLPDAVDAVVPLMLVRHDFSPEKGKYAMAPNPRFVEDAASVIAREGRGKDEAIFVTCQAGGRTARAVDALTKAGYGQVYALFEGIEGDLNSETGLRDLNGWKNAGLPWSYRITAAQAWQPAK